MKGYVRQLLSQASDEERALLTWNRIELSSCFVFKYVLGHNMLGIMRQLLNDSKITQQPFRSIAYSPLNTEQARIFTEFNLKMLHTHTLLKAVANGDTKFVKAVLRDAWRTVFVSSRLRYEDLRPVVHAVCEKQDEEMTWLLYRYMRHRMFSAYANWVDNMFYEEANRYEFIFVVSVCIPKPFFPKTSIKRCDLFTNCVQLETTASGMERCACGRKDRLLFCWLNRETRCGKYSPVLEAWSFSIQLSSVGHEGQYKISICTMDKKVLFEVNLQMRLVKHAAFKKVVNPNLILTFDGLYELEIRWTDGRA